jgi:hypothetical protein
VPNKHQAQLHELIGEGSKTDPKLRAAQRLHQGWWRAFVLGVAPGPHPVAKEAAKGRTIRNTVPNNVEGAFLTAASERAYAETLVARAATGRGSGLLDEVRATSNLLSSQPMAFNLFGELAQDLALATRWLQSALPDVVAVETVLFEYQPEQGSIGDNSAFDVALHYRSPAGLCLFGIEVKYTDDFSAKNRRGQFYGGRGHRNEANYRAAYQQCDLRVSATYEECIENTDTNQLFRNVLMAESALSAGQFVEVTTALLCHPTDSKALACGAELATMLNGHRFLSMTAWSVLESLQRLPLTEEQREWTMMFWARYLGIRLSSSVSA